MGLPGVEEPENVLRLSRYYSSNNEKTGHAGRKAQERVPFTKVLNRSATLYFLAADYLILSADKSSNISTASTVITTGEQRFLRKCVAGISVYVKKSVENFGTRDADGKSKSGQ